MNSCMRNSNLVILRPAMRAQITRYSLPHRYKALMSSSMVLQLHTNQRWYTAAAAKGFGEKPPAPPPKEKQMRMGNQPSARQQLKKTEELVAAAREAATAAESDPDDVVDPRVTDRMLKRVILFSGTPVLFGLLLFPFFWYLKVVQKVDLPMGTVFISSGLAFGAGLLGISYGAVSASWDPAREGSVLGWNEFRANFAAIMNQRKST